MIAEIETDKATMEVEAVDEGTVAKIVVPAGTEGVKVNALIAVLAGEGEDVAAAACGRCRSGCCRAAKAEAARAEGRDRSRAVRTGSAAGAGRARGRCRLTANRTFSSPLARRLAKEAGIDLSAIAGSGPHGRVVKSDVEAAVAGGGAKAAPRLPPQRCRSTGSSRCPRACRKTPFSSSSSRAPTSSCRMTACARRLPSAWWNPSRPIPHFYVTVDCELDALLALRAQLNDAAPKSKDGVPAYKLSVNDMVIKAMALALRDVPDANVSWTDNNMVKHKHADVGVAVSIPGGLITPIIRKAETKTLSAISNEMKDLGKRAKDRKLKPEEYQGGTTVRLQHGHDGRQELRRRHQPAACDDPRGRRGRAARHRQEGRDGDRHRHERHAFDRPPLRRRCARCRTAGRPSRAISKTRWACSSEHCEAEAEMTKTVLCYGDSLTWGYNAETIGRHAYRGSLAERAADRRSASEARVIPEGLNGRTTAFDDHLADCDRNGARILPTILQTHAPLDLVIIMLGTNDMKPVVAGSAFAACQGIARLVQPGPQSCLAVRIRRRRKF